MLDQQQQQNQYPQQPQPLTIEQKIQMTKSQPTLFVPPPFNYGEGIDIYPQRLKDEILDELKFYTMYGDVVPLPKQISDSSSVTKKEEVNRELKSELKMMAYKIYNQMLAVLKVLSGKIKEKGQVQIPRQVAKFFEVCQIIKEHQRREVLCGYLEAETRSMKKETQQINQQIEGIEMKLNCFLQTNGIHPDADSSEEDGQEMDIETPMAKSQSENQIEAQQLEDLQFPPSQELQQFDQNDQNMEIQGFGFQQ